MAAVAVILPAVSASAQEHAADPEAMKAFVELIEAYRARPAWTVKDTVSVEMAQGEVSSAGQETTAEITYTEDGLGILKLRGFVCYLGDGRVQAIHEGTDHSYFSTPDDGSPYYALLSAFLDLPYPHVAIAFGEPEVDEWFCTQFHPKAPYTRPTSVEDTADGKRKLIMTSDNGRVEMIIDPERQLLDSMEVELTGGPFVQNGSTLIYEHRFEYELYEDAPMDESLVAFEPGKRQRVDMMATLRPRNPMPEAAANGGGAGGAPAGRKQLVGEPAPPILLATSDGGAIDLEDLRGNIVVLDFWATWCGPCRQALPRLHEVHDWAERKSMPVKIITVNVYETRRGQEDDPDQRLAKVTEFWKKNGFKLPVAMDYTDQVAAAYGVQGIPATFVIDADGSVHARHTGAGPDYADVLKRDILSALEKQRD